MHVSSAKENVKQYPQSLHPPTFRHALNLQKKFMYTVFEGKTGCDQLKGTCLSDQTFDHLTTIHEGEKALHDTQGRQRGLQ